MEHKSSDENSQPLYSDTQKHLTPWVANLTIDQSTATDQPSSHSSTESSNYTAFCPPGFLDSLPDVSNSGKPEFDPLKFDPLLDTPLVSNKSVHSLSSSISACDQSTDNGRLLFSHSQHNPNSISTGGTPPISPATMASTHSSPAITPMGGRTSNISSGKSQHPYHNHHTATPISSLYHQHTPPLSSPTGMIANVNSNKKDEENMMIAINEGPAFDSYPFIQQSSTMPMEFMMDSWSQHTSNISSASSSSTTNTSSTIGTILISPNSNNDIPGSNPLRSAQPRHLHAVTAARIIQQQESSAKLRPIIQRYLQSTNPTALGEKTVIIMSSKVAQKSYGTEKRFLCPPPTAILVGSTWWTRRNKRVSGNSIGHVSADEESQGSNNGDDDEQQQNSFCDGHGDTMTMVVPPKVTVSISGESSSQAGQMEWYIQNNGAVAGQTGSIQQQQTQSLQTSLDASSTRSRFNNLSSMETKNNGGDWYHNPRAEPLGGGRCVSKQLYINDADEKRKRVECLVKLQMHGQWLGTLTGKGIKVISKPSKKRQSVKNVELCIHHGSIVSLFNRIRSQTVSTKYLGVSNGKDSAFAYPGQPLTGQTKSNDGACFVARMASWDPFVVWLVDTSRSSEQQQQQHQQSSRTNNSNNYPEDYIGHHNFKTSVNYPPPPAIALRNTTQQPLAIHYNQHIVLQCLSTGMVSPVFVIRRVDKASTVVGGARCMDEAIHINGGEYGDEYLGDPVCQLHKIALQMVHDPSQTSKNEQQQQQQQQQQPHNGDPDMTTGLMEGLLPRQNSPVVYLACLNDIVGMHKSTEPRQPILKSPPLRLLHHDGRALQKRKISGYTSSPSLTNNNHGPHDNIITSTYSRLDDNHVPQQNQRPHGSAPANTMTSELDNSGSWINHRSQSVSAVEPRHRQVSSSSLSSSSTSSSLASSTTLPISPSSTSWINGPLGGAYWHEDVSDAAIWTIVGTDIASYTFLPPPHSSSSPAPNFSLESSSSEKNNVDNTAESFHQQQQQHRRGLTPSSSQASLTFPHLSHYSTIQDGLLQLHGNHLARDLQVWFGDIQAPHVEYKSRELLICRLPPRNELLECTFTESYPTSSTTANTDNNTLYQLPLLLVKTADDIIHNTNIHYQF
ncbi:hypothetical protein BCR42DRAFT_415007 [Absidia repens]|uniref:LAG1-DNAbind-domain-containing protein n=1 Tax=Absidia repens TaxID=90262 RepID=A0A1X2IHB5_9FUNG|nr:hypothetical protein BCR42DRAFT_415007 [Absidia repens]